MSQEFQAGEIYQRTKDDEMRPPFVFDIARWADTHKAGAISATIVDVQVANSTFGSFTIPRSGLYRLLFALSCGVAATPRIVRLLSLSAGGEVHWESRVTMTSGGRLIWPMMELFLHDGESLVWQLITAMVLGDDMTGSISNWELAV